MSLWPNRAGEPILINDMRRISRSRYVAIFLLVGVGIVASLAFAAGLSHRNAYRYLNVFQEVWALTNANYVEAVDEPELLQGAYQGMLASLDAVSGYLSDEQLALLQKSPGPARPGFELLPSGGVPIIVRIDPGGPADAVGLKVGDQIWKVADTPTRNLALPLLERLVAGSPGERLDLVVFGGSEFKLRKISLELSVPTDAGFTLEDKGDGLLYLRLRSIERVDPVLLGRRLRAAQVTHSTSALLIDLRAVIGLDPASVSRFSGLLFAGGSLMRFVPRIGKTEVITAPTATQPVLPTAVYVLTDASTAGMGEALAALLSEKSSAVSCGRKTYGLGVLPEVIPLREGGQILLSTRAIETSAGTRWAGEGLTPAKSFPVRSTLDLDKGKKGSTDHLLEQTLAWIRDGAPLEVAKPAAAAS